VANIITALLKYIILQHFELKFKVLHHPEPLMVQWFWMMPSTSSITDLQHINRSLFDNGTSSAASNQGMFGGHF
jgi:hypothetical protein